MTADLDGADAVILGTVVVNNRHVVVANVLLLLSVLSVVRLTRHQSRDVKYYCTNTHQYTRTHTHTYTHQSAATYMTTSG